MKDVTLSATSNLDVQTGELAAALIGQTFPGYASLFRREIEVYQAFHDLFLPWFVIAQNDSDVIGFSMLTASMMSTDLLMITWVAVHPDHRGQGLGTRLLDVCLKEVHRRNKPVLLATSVPGFYTKCGFRLVEEYNPALSHCLMAR
jgi:N-acetylglutamate synthase-like GNAT family acetyltransferase